MADLLHVDIGAQSELAVVGSSTPDAVSLTAPVATTVPRDAVVGTVVLRIWPLSRFGTVSAASTRRPSERPRDRPRGRGSGRPEGRIPSPTVNLRTRRAGTWRPRTRHRRALSGMFTAAVREVVVVVVMALVLSFIVKTWLLQAFFIPSGSMEDTLLVGDRVIV